MAENTRQNSAMQNAANQKARSPITPLASVGFSFDDFLMSGFTTKHVASRASLATMIYAIISQTHPPLIVCRLILEPAPAPILVRVVVFSI